ncbi:hypothetical protein BE08_19310 [Sorangium cellulosum]|uniref:Uncharacterized protein n=1 Tax=Sorangium cellulosum TaxID=56 RepID=A0A150P0S9_SORCE|nr:hypothetical protein BE08_19310 [Sorangium cellulosum]
MKPKDQPGAGTLEIPLRRPYRDFVLSALFFAACAAVLAHRSWVNDRGLILNGIVTFERGGADVFYAVLAILSGVFCALGVLVAARFAALKEFRIVLGPRSITLPSVNPLRDAREVTVPLHRIEAVELQPPARPITLVVCEDDRSHSIPQRWLTKGWSAQGVADAIIARVREAQAKQRAGG